MNGVDAFILCFWVVRIRARGEIALAEEPTVCGRHEPLLVLAFGLSGTARLLARDGRFKRSAPDLLLLGAGSNFIFSSGPI